MEYFSLDMINDFLSWPLHHSIPPLPIGSTGTYIYIHLLVFLFWRCWVVGGYTNILLDG